MNERIHSTELFLFDMDGTLYLGDRLFDFTLELLDQIRAHGKRYMFITNNSSKSVDAYVERLAKFGIAATAEDFMTSSQATAFYLHEHFPDKRLYVAGTASLQEELRKNGFTLTDRQEDTECIIVGFDRELVYKKLYDISQMLCTRDLPYIATNPDYVCPTEWGSIPDCGSICDMLYNATGKRPVFIGKPSPLMIELACKKAGCPVSRTAVIGDRIYTDVKSGLNAGALAVLVMSGETTEEILQASPDRPDIVLRDAGLLTESL